MSLNQSMVLCDIVKQEWTVRLSSYDLRNTADGASSPANPALIWLELWSCVSIGIKARNE